MARPENQGPPVKRFWRRHRALALMARHERWRVAMGCPGVVYRAMLAEGFADSITPRRGEIYCRCERCHAARELLGWESLR
jgi:hypothetical protein